MTGNNVMRWQWTEEIWPDFDQCVRAMVERMKNFSWTICLFG